MSKIYFSAQELAEMELPGLPTNSIEIIKKAKQENWTSSHRPDRDGGYKFSVTDLPQYVQDAITTTGCKEHEHVLRVLSALSGLPIQRAFYVLERVKATITETEAEKHD